MPSNGGIVNPKGVPIVSTSGPEIFVPNAPKEKAPDVTDYWKVDVPEMQRVVEQIGDDSYTLYLADAQVSPWQDSEGNKGEYPGRFTAYIKWDGCVHLTSKNPLPGHEEEEADYMHVCDLDDFIERLLALRTIAKSYFTNRRGEWPA